MLLPILWCAASRDDGLAPLLISFAAGIGISTLLACLGRGGSFEGMGAMEAALSVVLSWLGASFIIALPYYISGTLPNMLDAFFEGISGLTTTGASVIPSLESVPRSILLWRSFSQWVGGLGIIVLILAVLPLSGASGAGMQLYRAEVSSPIHRRLTPRIQQTAAFLWKTYIALTAAQILLLSLGGLGIYDSATLAFSTVATGGFSPYQDSVGHFGGSYVKWVTAVFLFLSGINLTVYHSLIVRRNVSLVWRDAELRFYVVVLVTFGTLTSLLLYSADLFPSLVMSVLEGFFHVVSMLSTCGFFISDYNLWPTSVRCLMLVLMFCGGCAISTSGGISCIRIVVILKHVLAEFSRLLHPRAMIPTRLGGDAVETGVVSSCFAFFAAYMGIFMLGFAALTLFGEDMTTAISSAAAALGNVGPGFGMAGPSEGYAFKPPEVKLVHIALMLCGRLEIFTLLIVFTPSLWRRRGFSPEKAKTR
jgi:trk system potassium uptake protein TrkH